MYKLEKRGQTTTMIDRYIAFQVVVLKRIREISRDMRDIPRAA